MSGLDLLFSMVLTLTLHATALLAVVWLAEKLGALRHAGWAELAWRVALFGALVSTGAEFAPQLRQAATPVPVDSIAAPADARALEALVRSSQPVLREPTVAETTPSATFAPVDAEISPAGPLRISSGIAFAVIGLWLLVTGLAALRLFAQLLSLVNLRRSSRRHGQPASAALNAMSAELAATLKIPAPELRLSSRAQSPMALPGGIVLLPTWCESLAPHQQRAMLAHELTHLARRDPAWRIALRVAALPLSFHPLAALGQRRLDDLAEDACDTRAAELLGSGRPLAECLAACLSHAGPGAGHPALAMAMAGKPGPVVRRVQNLLEDLPMKTRSLSPAMRRSALVVALAAAVALPGIAVSTYAGQAMAAGGWFEDLFSGTRHTSHNGNESFRSRDASTGNTLALDRNGRVEFNAAENDVVSLGDGAELRISEKAGGTTRAIRFHAVNGVVQREYKLDGKTVALDADGRAWLGRLLPRIMRETGMDADARAKRILARGGTDALLAEIGLIQADYAARRYFEALFANATLDDAQLKRALDLADDIDSDFELRHALQAALDSQKLGPGHQAQVLKVAESIDSDFELAELLSHFAETQPVSGDALPAWQAALASISSDFEHRRVLEALLDRGSETPGAVRVALESADQIASDFELRQVLEKAAKGTRRDPAAQAAWFHAADDIGSDFEHRSALEAMIQAGPVDVALANAVLDSTGDIGSDFEARQVLEALAKKMPADAALIERYRAAARGLGDYERGQAEKALDRFAIVN